MACFKTNRARMDYPQFQEQDQCVSTDIVEGVCKSVIGGRMKRGGMHWSVHGANAIMALLLGPQQQVRRMLRAKGWLKLLGVHKFLAHPGQNRSHSECTKT